MAREQGLHFARELGIACGRRLEERLPPGAVGLEHRVKKRVDGLPAVGIHVVELPSNSRASQARAISELRPTRVWLVSPLRSAQVTCTSTRR